MSSALTKSFLEQWQNTLLDVWNMQISELFNTLLDIFNCLLLTILIVSFNEVHYMINCSIVNFLKKFEVIAPFLSIFYFILFNTLNLINPVPEKFIFVSTDFIQLYLKFPYNWVKTNDQGHISYFWIQFRFYL
jgi:hypothetical protein